MRCRLGLRNRFSLSLLYDILSCAAIVLFYIFTLFSNEYLDGHSKMQPDLTRTHIPPCSPPHPYILFAPLVVSFPTYLCVHQANKSTHVKYIVMLFLPEPAKFICTDHLPVYCASSLCFIVCVFPVSDAITRYIYPPAPENFSITLVLHDACGWDPFGEDYTMLLGLGWIVIYTQE